MYKIMYKKFEGRVSRRPPNAGLRSSPSRIQDSIRELPDGSVSAGRRDAGGSRGMRCQDSRSHIYCGPVRPEKADMFSRR